MAHREAHRDQPDPAVTAPPSGDQVPGHGQGPAARPAARDFTELRNAQWAATEGALDGQPPAAARHP